MNPLQLVLVGTTLEVTAFLFEVPTGVVADTFSRRLSVILGMFFLGAGFVLTGMIPIFWMVLVCQVINGIGYTFLSGATEAWLADEVGEEAVGPIYVRSGQVSRIAELAGIGLNVLLASISLGLTYIAGGAIYILLGVFLILVMPESDFQPALRETNAAGWRQTAFSSLRAMVQTFRSGLGSLRGRPLLITLLLVAIFSGAASEGYDRLGDAHLLNDFTFPALDGMQPVAWFGVLGFTGTIFTLVVVELFRRRLERISQAPRRTAQVLLALNTLVVAATLTFALTGNFWLAALAMLARGALRSLAFPLYNAWLVQNIEARVRATVLSMVSQSDAIGQAVVGPAIGLVGLVASLRAAITASALLLAPISFFYGRVLQKGRLEGEAPSLEAAPAVLD
jgi:DHA3 family tetracycline resistance protein-like MFS transporter